MDSSQLLIHALEKLCEAKVEFVVCGGVACVLHGCQRTTLDLDLNVSLAPDNLERLLAALKILGLSPRVPVPMDSFLDPRQRQQWIDTKGALVFTVQSPDGLLQIDIFLVYPIAYSDLRAEAVTVQVKGSTIAVSSVGHLIAAKDAIEFKRPKDLQDLIELKAML